jgi:hypothetical protein
MGETLRQMLSSACRLWGSVPEVVSAGERRAALLKCGLRWKREIRRLKLKDACELPVLEEARANAVVVGRSKGAIFRLR